MTQMLVVANTPETARFFLLLVCSDCLLRGCCPLRAMQSAAVRLQALGHVTDTFTGGRPITVRPRPAGLTADGTPCDCVHLALDRALGNIAFAGVVSGINKGSNLGENVLYCGTVCAAREANLSGLNSLNSLNSLEVSVVTHPDDKVFHSASAAWYSHVVWCHYEANGSVQPWFLNLNVAASMQALQQALLRM